MPRVQNPSIGSGASALLEQTVALTSAQILALTTTTITLVAAPGAGKVIIPLQIASVFTFGTLPYLSADGGSLGIQYAGGTYQNINGSVPGVIGALADTLYYSAAFLNTPQAILPGADNVAMTIKANLSIASGPIVTTTLGAGGLGYAVNDTGTILVQSGDATYKVLTVGAGGAVLTYQITGAGTSYDVQNAAATMTGGAQPGVGVGFTVNITAVNHGDGTLKVTTYYQVLAVP